MGLSHLLFKIIIVGVFHFLFGNIIEVPMELIYNLLFNLLSSAVRSQLVDKWAGS